MVQLFALDVTQLALEAALPLIKVTLQVLIFAALLVAVSLLGQFFVQVGYITLLVYKVIQLALEELVVFGVVLALEFVFPYLLLFRDPLLHAVLVVKGGVGLRLFLGSFFCTWRRCS